MKRDPTKEQILQAYNTLDVPVGMSLDRAMEEYRFLAGKLHPDRSTSEPDRKKSEAKLKKLNNAKDILTAHFKSPSHKSDGSCICGVVASPKPSQSASKDNATPEQAQKPSSKRLEHEKGTSDPTQGSEQKQTSEKGQRETNQAKQNSTGYTIKLVNAPNPENLRWTLSITAGVIYVGLVILSLFGQSSNFLFSGLLKHRSDDTPPSKVTTIQTEPPAPIDLEAQRKAKIQSDLEEEHKKLIDKQMSIADQMSLQRGIIDQNQMEIDACNRDIQQYQSKTRSQNLNMYQKRSAEEVLEYKENNLDAAQKNLVEAERKLEALKRDYAELTEIEKNAGIIDK